MASAAPSAPTLPPGAHPSNGINGDSSDWLELVRVFESMRAQMAKAEQKLNSERLANRQAEQHIEKERKCFDAEMAEQRSLLAEERREAKKEREALEAEKRALEAQRQVQASTKPPMPSRSPPPQSASSQAPTAAPEARSRVKAVPAAKVKEAPKPRGTASLDLPPPKAKARNPTPVAEVIASSEASTAAGVADGGSCSSGGVAADTPVARDLEIEDVDALSDGAKPEEADEADRLALEDDAESTQQPAKAPPEPPIYWRHVKPPPKTNPDKADDEDETEAKEESVKKVEVKAPAVKANPAYASRPKAPPAMQEEEVGQKTPSADNDGAVTAPPFAPPGRPPPKASDSAQAFGVLKAPPARAPPKASQVKAPPAADRDDVPKGKVKAPPSGDRADAPAVVPKGKVKAAPSKAKVKAPPGH